MKDKTKEQNQVELRPELMDHIADTILLFTKDQFEQYEIRPVEAILIMDKCQFQLHKWIEEMMHWKKDKA